jgi:hypothetical protein
MSIVGRSSCEAWKNASRRRKAACRFKSCRAYLRAFQWRSEARLAVLLGEFLGGLANQRPVSGAHSLPVIVASALLSRSAHVQRPVRPPT